MSMTTQGRNRYEAAVITSYVPTEKDGFEETPTRLQGRPASLPTMQVPVKKLPHRMLEFVALAWFGLL